MRIHTQANRLQVWLSARDTYDWAHKPGAAWPCSTLSDNRIFVEYDENGLCDLRVNGRYLVRGESLDSEELNACVSDLLKDKLPEGHALYFQVVGQFQP